MIYRMLKRCDALTRYIKSCRGFTIIEASIAAAVLALMVVGIGGVNISGLQSLDNQADRILLDSHLSSRMEALI
jgi:hypothetical protein